MSGTKKVLKEKPVRDRIDDNERTNAVGLFNTARSYWRSTEHLNAAAAQIDVTHPLAPVTFLWLKILIPLGH